MTKKPWPANARFQYGDPVHVRPSREGAPRFSGHVVGWYEPRNGRHFGYAIEHDRDGHIHVEPEGRLHEGLGL